MFRTILVPLDGSPLAERALPYAEALARATAARLLLVRAAVARTFSGVHTLADERGALHDAEAYLARVAAQLTERGIPVTTASPYGEAADSIVAEAQLQQADLLVMATHGRAGLNRWLYGSVAQAVLTRATVPVLLVRAWQADSVQPLLAPRPRIIVPLDGSAFAEEAVRPAQALAIRLGGELVLVRAISSPDPLLAPEGIIVPLTPVDLAELRAEAREYLRRLGNQLTDGCPVREEIQTGAPDDVIASVGTAHGAALVVMATHGRTGASRLFLGSVADAVMRHGNIPVLLVRPTGLDGDEVMPGDLVTLAFAPDEIVLLRAALRTFEQTAATGPDHLHERIAQLLSRLEEEQQSVVP